MKLYLFIISFVLTLFSQCSLAQAEAFDECMKRLIVGASPETTVGEIQTECSELANINVDPIDTVTEEKLASEEAVETNQFSLLQHRTNYVLPLAYNFKAESIEPSTVPGDTQEVDSNEFKFQVSIKTPLWNKPFGVNAKLFAAYTNTSWWQAYNRNESSPFRETNHQPELFLEIPSNLKLGTWELAEIRLGINHISNGRSGEFSRTWNRVFAEFAISNEHSEVRFIPWSSISSMEDNPDIEEFRGRFELAGTHILGSHTLGWNARHTLDNNSRGSVEIDWSFPISGRDDTQFFLQLFEGYGESLIDYNLKSRRLGIGVKLGL